MAKNFRSLTLFGLSCLLFTIRAVNSSSIRNVRNRVITTPDLCSSPEFDAITRTNDGNTYVFKGSYYWRVLEGGLAPGYPRFIQRDWPGLPANIDAALTWRDGKTFFFKGDSYWRFKSRVPANGYPKKISVGFAGIPDDLDAALLWGGNANTYFFKGDQYWKFETQSSRKKTAFGYPKNISLWAGVPANLNAAFQWENSQSYFFKGNQYYGFDDREFKVKHHDDLPYPRNTATSWFGCKMETTSAVLISLNSSPEVTSTLESTDIPLSETPTTSITVEDMDNSFVKDQPQSRDASSEEDHMDMSTDKTVKSTKADLTEPLGNSISDNYETESNIAYTTTTTEELGETDPEVASTKIPRSFVDNKNELDLSEPIDDETTSTDASSQIEESKAVSHSDSTLIVESKSVTHSENVDLKSQIPTESSTEYLDPKAVAHLSRVNKNGATKSAICFGSIAFTCLSMVYVWFTK